jgi:ABC-type nickel/cobalt efflux system permease component RcnA
MPVTFILLLIYSTAIVVAVIGVTRKIKTLKIISVLLFLIGIALTITVALALKNM